MSSHVNFAEYLNVMYIPFAEELVIFISAFVGACIGFLWFNSYPAQVFMGDTGSLAIGGILILLQFQLDWRIADSCLVRCISNRKYFCHVTGGIFQISQDENMVLQGEFGIGTIASSLSKIRFT